MLLSTTTSRLHATGAIGSSSSGSTAFAFFGASAGSLVSSFSSGASAVSFASSSPFRNKMVSISSRRTAGMEDVPVGWGFLVILAEWGVGVGHGEFCGGGWGCPAIRRLFGRWHVLGTRRFFLRGTEVRGSDTSAGLCTYLLCISPAKGMYFPGPGLAFPAEGAWISTLKGVGDQGTFFPCLADVFSETMSSDRSLSFHFRVSMISFFSMVLHSVLRRGFVGCGLLMLSLSKALAGGRGGVAPRAGRALLGVRRRKIGVMLTSKEPACNVTPLTRRLRLRGCRNCVLTCGNKRVVS